MDKIESLELINPRDSGLKNFDRKKFKTELKDYQNSINPKILSNEYYKLLGLFLLDKNKDLNERLNSDPSLVSNIETKSLKILNLLLCKEEIKEIDIFPFSAQELQIRQKVARSISHNIVDLVETCIKNIADFNKNILTELYSLSNFLPDLKFHLAIYILRTRQTKFYDLVSNNLPENLKEKTFIEAFLLRIEKKDLEAEKKLLEYRAIFDPDANLKPKLILESNEKIYPPAKTLENWTKILDEVKNVQEEIELNAGLYSKTCEYFSCSDCCSYTFPAMSYTEFKFLENWMKKNNYDVEKIKAKAKEIQNDHQERFGKKLELVDKSIAKNNFRGSENPKDYKFTCPFLEEGKCSIHEARPILCRAFASASDNAMSIKTCQYYLKQYQHNSDPENNRYALDLRPLQSMVKASDKYLTKEDFGKEQELFGTIVAWFSQG